MLQMQNIIYTIGFYGNKINPLITLLAIYPNIQTSFLFIIGYFLNSILNKYLKGFFKEERPPNPILFYETEDKFYKNEEAYGFPSGHAQSVFYSFVFLCLTSFPKKNTLIILSLLITIFTIIQRYIFNRHTIKQLLGGACIGSMVALIIRFFTLQ